LKEFSLNLVDENLAPNSINKILLVGTTALSWAFNEGMIAVDPSEGLLRFSGISKKRGVLTPQEAETQGSPTSGGQEKAARLG
jgi:hypothetical protein